MDVVSIGLFYLYVMLYEIKYNILRKQVIFFLPTHPNNLNQDVSNEQNENQKQNEKQILFFTVWVERYFDPIILQIVHVTRSYRQQNQQC